MAKAPHSEDGIKIAEESGICGDSDGLHLESRFECPICLTWLREPVLTSCGHKFCSECINTWLRKEGASCPVDSKPLKPESDLFRDLYTSREISQQRTHCPYQEFGCALELSRMDLEAHVSQCPHRRNFECPFKKAGCLEDFQSEEARSSHLEKSIVSHLTLLGSALPRLTSLVESNARDLESKFWEAPPKNASTSVAKDGNSSPLLTEWQQLLKSLYERIVVLEQQNRELNIMLSNQRNQLTTMQTSIRFNNEEMNLKHCNGLYIWRLASFADKLETMRSDPLKMFYSPGFYTSPNGYKICARINISSKNPHFLSLLVHLMHSKNDDALDWPFNGLISFVLVHASDSERNIRETAASKPELEAFRKPTSELNKRSFGYTEFVAVRDLDDFLQDDSLIFRIEVRSA
ncbi:TNF receptor-associated factor 6 [Cephus cinctus]|uniref:TNF receptor-associated factor 6 n=1 Tax=Cephus cinctus TaxID=211228 RepID=A0AAJ7W1M6_CEPCN|nr:TNF receptor-associated factor 6 [Cephus cinctus]XP_024941225.1 TNF receptor-associated factor 6 [Cephus cinctus]